MTKTGKTKKLNLKKTTVRNLSATVMRGVGGAFQEPDPVFEGDTYDRNLLCATLSKQQRCPLR